METVNEFKKRLEESLRRSMEKKKKKLTRNSKLINRFFIFKKFIPLLRGKIKSIQILKDSYFVSISTEIW